MNKVTVVSNLNVLGVSLNALGGAEYVQIGCSSGVCCPFDTLPIEYVRFAREDMRLADKRGVLNAFHNAKRAIDCQMDRIFWNLGVARARLSMPRKFELLRDLGAAAPNLLGQLIKQRNLLEHAYKTATPSETEDAVDLAEMFVRATDSIARHRLHDALVVLNGNLTFFALEQATLTDECGEWQRRPSRDVEERPNAIAVRAYTSLAGPVSVESFERWYGSCIQPGGGPPTEFAESECVFVTMASWELYMCLVRLVVKALKDEDR
jgi:hypothetical protein